MATKEESADKYISLQEATKYCNYSQDYLSLRARQGKLKALKFGRNWVTKKEWLEEYLGRIEEYENNLKAKKLVSPPKISPIEKVRKLWKPDFLRLRFGFVFALALILMITGGVFGKESFKNVYESLNPIVSEIGRAGDLVIKEVFETTKGVVTDSFSRLEEFSQDFNRTVMVPAASNIVSGLAEVSSEIGSGISRMAEKAELTGISAVQKISQVSEKELSATQETLAGLVSSETLETISSTFKEYGKWLTTQIETSALAVKTSIERRITDYQYGARKR